MHARPVLPALLLGLALLLLPMHSQAALFSSDLSASGFISFDTANSTTTAGSQSGELQHQSGGALNSAAFNNGPPSPDSLNGSFSDIGDGVGMLLSLAGDVQSAAQSNQGVFGDFGISLSNLSATAIITVTLQLSSNFGLLSASGQDAYLQLDTFLDGIDVYGRRWRDTLNGDVNEDSASALYTVVLNPGDSASISGNIEARFGAFSSDGLYSGQFSPFLSIAEVTVRDDPPEVPEPGMLVLLFSALGLLLWQRRALSLRSAHDKE